MLTPDQNQLLITFLTLALAKEGRVTGLQANLAAFSIRNLLDDPSTKTQGRARILSYCARADDWGGPLPELAAQVKELFSNEVDLEAYERRFASMAATAQREAKRQMWLLDCLPLEDLFDLYDPMSPVED